MKSTFSEQYYRTNWARFIKKIPGEYYINLENELQHAMEIYTELPAEAIEKIKKIEAKNIADKCTETLKKHMKLVKSIKAGSVSLGYTTQTQEIQAANQIVTRFEFNCLQLADFVKKYEL